jgi:hypothetical protein
VARLQARISGKAIPGGGRGPKGIRKITPTVPSGPLAPLAAIAVPAAVQRAAATAPRDPVKLRLQHAFLAMYSTDQHQVMLCCALRVAHLRGTLP